jgi:hypothetical protein
MEIQVSHTIILPWADTNEMRAHNRKTWARNEKKRAQNEKTWAANKKTRAVKDL